MDDATSGTSETSVLFVCLGNICRSPMAEGVFRHLLAERGLAERVHVDSAGTGAWHVGEPPDPRARAEAARHGVELGGTARQVEPEDFERFDRVIAMDRDNLRVLERMASRAGAGAAAPGLLRDFDPEADGDDVPDPYYGGPGGFENVFRMILRSCEALLREIESGGSAS